MFGARTLALAAFLTAVVAAGCGGTEDSQSETATQPPTAPVTTDSSPTATDTTATPRPKPKPPKPTTITIRVVNGGPQGGIVRPTVKKDTRVVLLVRSDTADEVHLHGYDISRPVAAGGRARLAFVADIPGRFEVELENHGVQIAELTVR